MIDLLEIGKSIFEARQKYKQRKNAEEYIEFLEETNNMLKLNCEELEKRNNKLQQELKELTNTTFNKNHATVLKWFEDTEGGMIEEYEINKRLVNRDLKIAYYELIDNDLIRVEDRWVEYCFNMINMCYLNENQMTDILKIIDQFYPE